MKKNEIKVNEIYAVVTGGMYEGAEAFAVPARIMETSVEVENFNGRTWSRHPSSRTRDGVRVELLDRRTLEPQLTETGDVKTQIVKTRNIVATWEDHVERQQSARQREATEDQHRKDVATELDEWCTRLGIQSYQLPNLSGGIGSRGWDNTYTYNRAALIKVIKVAYELGKAEGEKS